jgi:hypothetical protein
MPVQYIHYKGKTILLVDFSNMNGAQAIATLNEEAKEMQTWSEKGLVLNLFYNAKATSEFMAHAKKLGRELFTEKIHKSAAVGLTGLQMILLQAYNTFSQDKLTPFRTEDEAKEWLIKQE